MKYTEKEVKSWCFFMNLFIPSNKIKIPTILLTQIWELVSALPIRTKVNNNTERKLYVITLWNAFELEKPRQTKKIRQFFLIFICQMPK